MKLIKMTRNKFPDSLCDKLIAMFEEYDAAGKTHSGQHGHGKKDISKKHSTDLDLTLDGSDPLHMELYKEMVPYLKDGALDYINEHIPNYKGELNYLTAENSRGLLKVLQPPRLKRYKKPKESYNAWHQDWGLSPEQIQRFLVVMIYLNDVELGGETEFFHQQLRIKPEKGKMVIFPPYYTHMHRASKPLTHDKYICNFYVGLNAEKVG